MVNEVVGNVVLLNKVLSKRQSKNCLCFLFNSREATFMKTCEIYQTRFSHDNNNSFM
jgi:hypothetical protein